jgi:hypothetical protein
LIQSINVSENEKSINNIYLSKKQSLNYRLENPQNLVDQYKDIIEYKSYILTKEDKSILSEILDEHEYALSSHNLFDAKTNKFALQIVFETLKDKETYSDDISELLYREFATFLHKSQYIINIELLMLDFMKKHNIKLEYTIFNEADELDKINNENYEIETSYIIKNDNYLPILKGNFDIVDSDAQKVQLFSDINIVITS